MVIPQFLVNYSFYRIIVHAWVQEVVLVDCLLIHNFLKVQVEFINNFTNNYRT